jgi:hydrogenase-4 component B
MITFFAGLWLILAGGIVGLVTGGGRVRAAAWAYGALTATGGGLSAWTAVRVLLGGTASLAEFQAAVPGGPWRYGLDPLSAWFVLVVLGVGVPAAIYGIGYLEVHRTHGSVRLARGGFALLLVSMAFVVTARAVMPFLIAWEVMALSAYLLVVFEDRQSEVRRAGLVYLVATHVGTLLLFVMFALWGGSAPDLTFDSLARATRPDGERAAILLLALAGFGLKAGLVPLHFWLPEAHAAAPSHVSAIMSGVVIKTGIYGLLRVMSLVPAPAWWGWSVLLLGIVSGVLGVVWALAQHDLKRLLAYHSVENVGIILIGVGLGALGRVYDAPLVAVLGFAGAALHTANHALFKGLLFLGAGAVANATGTRQIALLGGLRRSMPLTWLLFLVGSAAIVGLPPLNGFVSEWLVFQGLFQSGLAKGAVRLAVFGVAGLALIGGLALACFAKVGGAVFLGHPRSPRLTTARDAPVVLLAPMIWLALGCGLIGLFPQAMLPVLARVSAVPLNGSPAGFGVTLRAAAAISAIGGATIVLVVLASLVRRAVVRPSTQPRRETWGCGYARPDERMQYTASSFAAPLVGAFGQVSGSVAVRGPASLHTEPRNLVLDRALVPFWHAVRENAAGLRRLHQGGLQRYVLYVVGTVVGLLVYLMMWGQP